MRMLTAVVNVIIWNIFVHIPNRKRSSVFLRLTKNIDALVIIIGSLICSHFITNNLQRFTISLFL